MAAEDRVETDASSTETVAPAPSRRSRKPRPDTAGDIAAEPAAAPAEPVEAASAPGVDEDGEDIVAEVVEVHQGAVGRVDAGDVGVTMGAIAFARAERVVVERGAIGAVLADEVEVSQGMVQTVLAREVELEQAFARTVIAGNVTVEKPSFIGLLVAGRVEGAARPIIDWRGALVIGGLLVAAMALFGRRRGED